jgi:hypothetical protein
MGPPAPFLSCDRLQLILPNGVHWTIPAILALDWLMLNRNGYLWDVVFYADRGTNVYL